MPVEKMSLFTAIQDMSDSSLILSTLRDVGFYFNSSTLEVPSPPLSEPGHHPTEMPALSRVSPPDRDKAYKSAGDVLHPLAFYLQNKASEEQKEELGGMLAAQPEIVQALCDGILSPFVQG